MIVYRTKYFSVEDMLTKISRKLDQEGIEDYETSDIIPKDSISIYPDLKKLVIYIPVDFEYSQYGIDDFLRSMIPYMRTSTILDRNIFKMTLSGPISEAQLYKLVKYIISEEEFIVLLEEE